MQTPTWRHYTPRVRSNILSRRNYPSAAHPPGIRGAAFYEEDSTVEPVNSVEPVPFEPVASAENIQPVEPVVAPVSEPLLEPVEPVKSRASLNPVESADTNIDSDKAELYAYALFSYGDFIRPAFTVVCITSLYLSVQF